MAAASALERFRLTIASAMTVRTPTHWRDTDVESRRPVWIALSELFLDTTLDSADIDRIAKTLAGSRYSLGELDRILLWEVYPACHRNLWSIAGEWAGFDPGWLESRILRGPSLLALAWAGTLGRIGVRSSLHWGEIRRGVEAHRTTRRDA
jgi:hypothetical protein